MAQVCRYGLDALMRLDKCANNVFLSLSDETGVLRFTSFDIIGVPHVERITEVLREYLIGRPLADVDMAYLRGVHRTDDGGCLRTVINMVEDYQRIFVR